jgi:hypothetical protein
MAKNLEMIDKIIDDLATGKYDSAQEAIDDLVFYGEDPNVARISVMLMEDVDVID